VKVVKMIMDGLEEKCSKWWERKAEVVKMVKAIVTVANRRADTT
jgi:hypothetical protein